MIKYVFCFAVCKLLSECFAQSFRQILVGPRLEKCFKAYRYKLTAIFIRVDIHNTVIDFIISGQNVI